MPASPEPALRNERAGVFRVLLAHGLLTIREPKSGANTSTVTGDAERNNVSPKCSCRLMLFALPAGGSVRGVWRGVGRPRGPGPRSKRRRRRRPPGRRPRLSTQSSQVGPAVPGAMGGLSALVDQRIVSIVKVRASRPRPAPNWHTSRQGRTSRPWHPRIYPRHPAWGGLRHTLILCTLCVDLFLVDRKRCPKPLLN